jgi:cytochrome c-type biogenesis protein CcmF
VTVLATRDGLRAWTVMLAVVAFSMSMIGTFLVRSGILTSVHAFAVDPQRGAFILALLALYIGGALAPVRPAGRDGEGGLDLRAGQPRRGAGRQQPAALGGARIVLVGTLYPLVTEAMGVKVSVGPPYFNLVPGRSP